MGVSLINFSNLRSKVNNIMENHHMHTYLKYTKLSPALWWFKSLVAFVSLTTCLVIVYVSKLTTLCHSPGKFWCCLKLPDSLAVAPQVGPLGRPWSPPPHPKRLSPNLRCFKTMVVWRVFILISGWNSTCMLFWWILTCFCRAMYWAMPS